MAGFFQNRTDPAAAHRGLVSECMETLDVEVSGGNLRALRWGNGPNAAVALHGITANAMSWSAVGAALPTDWSLIAVDLRGWGHSRELLTQTLGPALERLRQTWPDEESYVDLFRAHPAMGPCWSPAVEAYARYDALTVGDGVRARAVEDAVRASGRELLTRGQEITDALTGLRLRADLLVAEHGMFDQPGGLLPDPVVAQAVRDQPMLRLTRIPDTNHYTILFAQHAATAVTEAITGELTAPQ